LDRQGRHRAARAVDGRRRDRHHATAIARLRYGACPGNRARERRMRDRLRPVHWPRAAAAAPQDALHGALGDAARCSADARRHAVLTYGRHHESRRDCPRARARGSGQWWRCVRPVQGSRSDTSATLVLRDSHVGCGPHDVLAEVPPARVRL
jgi:hypothetical protein